MRDVDDDKTITNTSYHHIVIITLQQSITLVVDVVVTIDVIIVDVI